MAFDFALIVLWCCKGFRFGITQKAIYAWYARVRARSLLISSSGATCKYQNDRNKYFQLLEINKVPHKTICSLAGMENAPEKSKNGWNRRKKSRNERSQQQHRTLGVWNGKRHGEERASTFAYLMLIYLFSSDTYPNKLSINFKYIENVQTLLRLLMALVLVLHRRTAIASSNFAFFFLLLLHVGVRQLTVEMIWSTTSFVCRQLRSCGCRRKTGSIIMVMVGWLKGSVRHCSASDAASYIDRRFASRTTHIYRI